MDANIIIGSTVLVAAVAVGSFLAASVLAATKVREHIVVRSPRGIRAGRAPLEAGEPRAEVSPAQCYDDCMNGLDWNSEWRSLCRQACAVTGGCQ